MIAETVAAPIGKAANLEMCNAIDPRARQAHEINVVRRAVFAAVAPIVGRDRFFALLDAVDKRDLLANAFVDAAHVRDVFDQIVIYYRDKRNYKELHQITDRSLKAAFLRMEDAYLTKGLILMRQASDHLRDSERLAESGK